LEASRETTFVCFWGVFYAKFDRKMGVFDRKMGVFGGKMGVFDSKMGVF
jgi:peptide methionine sulfoxide reductase MsrA